MSSGSRCAVLNSGAVELLFYNELDAAERQHIAAHLRVCAECATALEELRMISAALASRPDVSAPPAGDWSGFMRRLDATIDAQAASRRSVIARFRPAAPPKPASTARNYAGLLATAALLAIVTLSVYFVARERATYVTPAEVATASPAAGGPDVDGAIAMSGLKSVGEQHFERSKLVVLGLVSKEAAETPPADWAYERELASSLLKDTRLYRLAAEEHGLGPLAGVMRDLELVLLETSMADEADPATLAQIQRLIRKRGLIEKMHTATVGM